MKKLIINLMAVAITTTTTAQTLVTGDLRVDKSLKLKTVRVTEISNDSTGGSKSNAKLITEKAAKNYVDSSLSNLAFDTSSIYNQLDNRWNVNGNSILPGQFIGTTNNEDLVFKSNNYEVAKFSSDGTNRVSLGLNATATGGNASFSAGNYTVASGVSSVAMGNYNTASNTYSVALGNGNISNGVASFTVNGANTASGSHSFASGNSSLSSGISSTALGGYGNIASGNNSFASGVSNISKSYAGVVIGTYNDSANAASSTLPNTLNRVFQIGNGTSNTSRSNAMTVLFNGNVGIGTTNPISTLQVNGSVRLADTLLLNDGGYAPSYLSRLYKSGAATTILEGVFLELRSNHPGGSVTQNTVGGFTYFNNLGQFSIGSFTPTPTARLHVEGSTQITGNLGIGTASSPNSVFQSAGSFALPYRAITATYTIDATDYTIDCTSNSFTVNLPTAVGITGRIYVIKNSGSATTITLDGNGTETIDGAATQTISFSSKLQVQSTGSNWIIL